MDNKQKPMRKALVPILLLLLFLPWLCGARKSPAPVTPDKVVLGFSLMPGPSAELVTYKKIRIVPGPVPRFEQSNITRHEFLSIALGIIESDANPTKENLFLKYEIKECFYQLDTIHNKMKYDFAVQCPVVDDLWRLRWGEYPYLRRNGQEDPGPGWANDPLGVSEGQFNILKKYGMVISYSDPIYGENAFRLLHDMQDPAWQSIYRGS